MEIEKKINSNDSSFAEIDNKYYIIIWRNNTNNNWRINKFNNNNILISIVNDNYPNLTKFRGRLQISNSATDRILWESDDGSYFKSVYRWDGNNDPQIPEIDDNGNLKYLSEYWENVRNFLLKYINVIVQENIRVQQGGNPDYDDPNLGSERIIFDFEIINNLDKSSTGIILTKKSIYQMILTIDEKKNIVAGSLELTHLKQYWNGSDYNSYRYTDDLGFLFSFMKEKEDVFNFSAETYNYYQGNTPNTGKIVFEQMKGQIEINKFLKAFFAHALVPVFQNRSNFIESGYIDNLQYDTV